LIIPIRYVHYVDKYTASGFTVADRETPLVESG
jgi:hypothetical protein